METLLRGAVGATLGERRRARELPASPEGVLERRGELYRGSKDEWNVCTLSPLSIHNQRRTECNIPPSASFRLSGERQNYACTHLVPRVPVNQRLGFRKHSRLPIRPPVRRAPGLGKHALVVAAGEQGEVLSVEGGGVEGEDGGGGFVQMRGRVFNKEGLALGWGMKSAIGE